MVPGAAVEGTLQALHTPHSSGLAQSSRSGGGGGGPEQDSRTVAQEEPSQPAE